VRVKCLAQEHIAKSSATARIRTAQSGDEEQTMGPPRLPQNVETTNRQIGQQVQKYSLIFLFALDLGS